MVISKIPDIWYHKHADDLQQENDSLRREMPVQRARLADAQKLKDMAEQELLTEQERNAALQEYCDELNTMRIKLLLRLRNYEPQMKIR